ncbi:MAG: alpha-ribazole phosphatase [Anaerolinea sp.]|nr:alpha-ribazole phosphatase [Anaerolinea sp.]
MAMPARLPPTRILVTRHGQTVTNREGRFCGHFETALTDLGARQARALGERLALTPIAAVYTSDLSRAMETARLVLPGRNLPHRIDARLRELHYGEWEGEKEREIARRYPEQHRLMREEDPAWRPPGGETIAEVRTRTYAALRKVAREHAHQTVLIVTHGTAINCMVSEAIGIALTHTFRFEVANCGLSELVFRRSGAVLTLLNDTAHLAGLK